MKSKDQLIEELKDANAYLIAENDRLRSRITIEREINGDQFARLMELDKQIRMYERMRDEKR